MEIKNSYRKTNIMLLNKKETLAQIFTDIRYKKADNELMSERLKLVLKEQGFDR